MALRPHLALQLKAFEGMRQTHPDLGDAEIARLIPIALRGTELGKALQAEQAAQLPERPFRFGDHVTFRNGGKDVFGMVAKVGRSKIFVQTQANGRGFDVPLRVVRHAEGALPAELTACADLSNLFRKGEFVEFEQDGKVVQGRVSRDQRAGQRVSVEDGSAAWAVPAPKLRRVAAPALPDAGPMADYSISNYKVARFASEETECFQCTVLHKGRPVLQASNEGRGGPNRLDPFRATQRGDIPAFEAACKAWAAWAGYSGDLYEADATWLDWEHYKRPMGRTAQDEAQEHEAHMAELRKGDIRPKPLPTAPATGCATCGSALGVERASGFCDACVRDSIAEAQRQESQRA